MPNPTVPTTDNVYDTTHHSLANLLIARGERLAAGIVALARYRSDRVHDYDGGQYQVTLEVPAEAYDQSCDELRACLDQACEDIIGRDHYAGLKIHVLAPPEDPQWAAKIIDVLRLRRVPSERFDVPAIGSANASR